MGLTWMNFCFCGNSPHYGTGNNANQADCPGGECPITDCDSTGTIADPPVGVADLCADGNPGTCVNRNAVYRLEAATISETTVSTATESGWTDEETARQFKYQGCFYQYAGAYFFSNGGERTNDVTKHVLRFCCDFVLIKPLLAKLSRCRCR